MSTDDSMIRIARVGNEFWIGTLAIMNKLMSPRVVGSQEGPLGRKMVCLEILGKPTFARIPDGCAIMDVTDDVMITAYREAVSGLTLATEMPKPGPHLVPAGRG